MDVLIGFIVALVVLALSIGFGIAVARIVAALLRGE